MIGLLKRRRMRKKARHCLHHARHCRKMREDIASPNELARLIEAEATLAAALKSRDTQRMETAAEDAVAAASVVMPPKPFAGLRENIEILVVAIAVAMAFRTYFIQPFKIPTGSMQPSLYGITSQNQAGPTLLDRPLLKNLKWIVTGNYYHEYRAKASGTVSNFVKDQWDPSIIRFKIGGKLHKVPIDAWNDFSRRQEIKVAPGQFVARGTLLWRGIRRAGDHVFVDRVRWNFFPPKRGQIIVFGTADIPTLPPGMHYIKRLVGLPGETISIKPPNVLVDGVEVHEPGTIERIASRQPGYAGYTLADPRSTEPCVLRSPHDSFTLSEREYLALGDNTRNSKDSRYWGGAPQRNMVGPAAFVYWPVTKRWGPIF
ncbi:MAG: signal peptidase I [Kiritimatiellia bacterium]|nr:signal peptidase I [Kiritimatiellia bacterium]MDP6810107.1 signal peptidase I [Kiritimatiellia bacterium]MDP7024878.1 signal peptidase I [Kiritimatiellia bacterium]